MKEKEVRIGGEKYEDKEVSLLYMRRLGLLESREFPVKKAAT